MLLGSAREELQALNQRWKDAEGTPTRQKRPLSYAESSTGCRKMNILEAEKVAIR